MIKKHFIKLIIVGIIFTSFGCSSSKRTDMIPVVKDFDINKYMGEWYEIARLPNSFQKGISESKAKYILLNDGRVEVINSGIKDGNKVVAKGVASFIDDKKFGDLKVTFFWPFYGAYRIIYLDVDYSISIVTSDTFDYLWILSRNKNIPNKEKYLNIAKEFGFDIEKIEDR